jgi:hypothetical protein
VPWPWPGGARAAAAALACALGAGVLCGALAGPATPGSAAVARRVVVASSAPSAVAGALPAADLRALQAPPPAPVASTGGGSTVAADSTASSSTGDAASSSTEDTAAGGGGGGSAPAGTANEPAAKKKPAAAAKPAKRSAPTAAKDELATLKHVVVVALADKGFAEAFGPASQAPYLARELRAKGALLRRYFATAHGSLPNYIALLSGQAANPATASGCAAMTPFVAAGKPASDGEVSGRGCVFGADVPSLPVQLEQQQLSWRAYVDGADPPLAAPATPPATAAPNAPATPPATAAPNAPATPPATAAPNAPATPPATAAPNAPATPPARCQPPPAAADGTRSAVDRNPFLFFAAIAGAPGCSARVTGLAPLAADLAAAADQAPAFTLIVPDPCSAGRDGACPPGEPAGVARTDGWLREWVPRLLASPEYADDGMIVITFDQARVAGRQADSTSCCGQALGVNEPESVDPQAPAPGGGRVGAIVLSSHVKGGVVSDVPYNHFALLRTIEDAFGLRHLGLAGATTLEPFGKDVFGAG